MLINAKHVAAFLGLLLASAAAFAQNATPASLPPAPLPSATLAPAPVPTADKGWPRTFTKDGYTVVMYQPQVDSWKDYANIQFLAAIAITTKDAEEPDYGAVSVTAQTLVDHDAGTVLITNMNATVNFSELPPAKAAPLQTMVKEMLASRPYLAVSLPRVLSYMHGKVKPPAVNVNLNPPTIYFSEVPAILVTFLGQPQFEPVSGAALMFAVNTNWNVFLDTASNQYYLLDGDSWLTAPDPVKGPWTVAQNLPQSISNIPLGSGWDNVLKHIPGTPPKITPAVYATTAPAELIVTNGPPAYSPIAGTRLMYVSNPEMPLFMDLATGSYYFLAAGRWFTTVGLWGPWTAASTSLPADFARIPPDCSVGFVLSSVPGTQQAEEAVLLASVPHTATINIKTATVNVTYNAAPKFVPIEGTNMTYAVNTSYQVVFANGEYYCCHEGVWFVSPAATGPWVVCTSVPAVIYTIPPTCPLYNTTYVQVYSSTPTTVVVGYTGGYSGEYVAATGTLMFGAGMLTGALIASSDHWCSYPPCYYSYGCAACYHSGYCGYYRGASCYGPYGGAGYSAKYNSSTGTWSRSAYAYGANGSSAAYHQAYNPYSNTYGAHASASNGYQSWGASTVSQGDKWASAQHETGPDGVSHGWAENSSGETAQGIKGPGNNAVATTSNGNTYAAHNGNVYKQNGDGQWQTHQDGGWQNVQTPKPTTSTSDWQSHANTSGSSGWGDSSGKWGGSSSSSSSWGSGSGDSSKSSWGSNWSNHDTQNSLNSDSWSRNSGNSWGGGGSRWGGDSGGWGGGGSRWGGGGFGGGGGRFGGFRR